MTMFGDRNYSRGYGQFMLEQEDETRVPCMDRTDARYEVDR
jgi:hypothetical protein